MKHCWNIVLLVISLAVELRVAHSQNQQAVDDLLNENAGYSYSDGCRTTDTSTNYMGKINKTIKGYTCQAWISQFPNEHVYANYIFPDGNVHDAMNYCRSLDHPIPWCITTDSVVTWDYCDVPVCGSMTCKLTEEGREYHGKIASTENGRICQAWASQSPHRHFLNSSSLFMELNVSVASNYCRNPNGRARLWCFTTDPKVEWEYCNVPLCGGPQNCKTSIRGIDYFGNVNITASGKTCQPWTSTTSPAVNINGTAFPEGVKAAARNYCRNPDNSSSPWCYTTDSNEAWNYCAIPDCGSIKPIAAYASRVNSGVGPENLIDFNYNNSFYTSEFGRHWVAVDLGSQTNVTKVRLYLANDKFKHLDGYEVEVRNNFNLEDYKFESTRQSCARINGKSYSQIADIGCSGFGRFVIIRAPEVKTRSISVNEIVVFGTRKSHFSVASKRSASVTATSEENGNLLLGKTLYASYLHTSASDGTDGDLYTHVLTKELSYAWIAIDMEEIMTVYSVRLWMNIHENAASTFTVWIGTTFLPCETASKNYRCNWQICKRFENINVTMEELVKSDCDTYLTGQYVIITYGTPGENNLPPKSLTFKEIEAIGRTTGRAGYRAPILDLKSNPLKMKDLFPLREAIFGSYEKLVDLPMYLNKIVFFESNSESLLWIPDSKDHIMVATQFGKGRIITSSSEYLIEEIMENKTKYAAAWSAMQNWLGYNRIRDINDDFVKGDLVVSKWLSDPSEEKIAKLLSMIKLGEIALIFAISPWRIQNGKLWKERTLYEICKATNVFVTDEQATYESTPTIDLPTESAPDFCAMHYEKFLEFSIKIPALFISCASMFKDIYSLPFSVISSLSQSNFISLTRKLNNQYHEFLTHYQPCEFNPLKDDNIKPFILAYSNFLNNPFLDNSGFKAPGVSNFPGDFDISPSEREAITITFKTGYYDESHPTGLYLPPGDTLTMDVTVITGAISHWQIAIGCHTDDISVRTEWYRFPLIHMKRSLEFKRIYSPFGGVVWIVSKYANETIEITFHNAVRGPFFNARATDAERKFDERKNLAAPWTELAGDAMIFCVPSSAIRGMSGAEVNHLMTRGWDKVVKMFWHTVGQDLKHSWRFRTSSDIQIEKGLAHSGYPIMNTLDWVPQMLNYEQSFTGEGYWGMFHEIGHNIETWRWEFDGFVEVVNNVLGMMYYETIMSVNLVQIKEEHVFSDERIEEIENYLSKPTVPEVEYFIGLGFFYQMASCFSWGRMQKVFQKLKSDDITSNSNLEKYDNFLLTLNEIVGYNVKPIFDYWAAPVSESVATKVSTLPCIMPNDLFAKLNVRRVNEIIANYGECTRTCPSPIDFTTPDFDPLLPNDVIEE